MKDEKEKKATIISLQTHTDARGKMAIAENRREIPFEIKRFFTISDSGSNVVRGMHANKATEFFLVCVAGSCKVRTRFGNEPEEVFSLNRPDIGLYLPEMIWKEMFEFSKDAVLLIMASTYFDPEDYVGAAEYNGIFNGNNRDE